MANQSSAMNLLTQYDYNLPNLQKQAEGSANTASQYQQAASLLPAQLKQAIEEKLNYNQDIISQKNQAQADYFAAPSTARSKYQDIFNPFEREQLVARATANAYAPYATLTDILGQRQGNIADIVQQGTGAFNAAVAAQQNQAAQDQTAYQNAIALAQWLYGVQHPSGGGVGSASYNLQLTQGLKGDISKGATLQDVMKKYADQIDPNSIYQLYNINSPYGPAKEDASQLQKMFGVTSPKGTTTKWQLKTDKISGFLGSGIGARTQKTLFDPATGRQIVPDNNGNVHVIDKSTGQTGYIPVDEFDSSKYDPVGD